MDSHSVTVIKTQFDPRETPTPSNGSVIQGTEGDDILIGTSRDDRINGKGGNDEIHGCKGNDS